MMQFDKYRWQDHRPRPGRWKLDLAVAVIAVGLLLGAGHEVPEVDLVAASASEGQLSPEGFTGHKSGPGAPSVAATEGTSRANRRDDIHDDTLGAALCDLSHSLDQATIRLRHWISGAGKEPRA